MTTPQILELLYSFNTFSPEFSHCLDRLIKSDEEDRYLLSLQGPELTRLVDFLDRVRVLPSPSSQLTKKPCRPSGSSPSLRMSLGDVYTSYKQSAATAGSCHLRTLFLVALSGLETTQSPPQIFPTCGKAPTTALKCASNTRESP